MINATLDTRMAPAVSENAVHQEFAKRQSDGRNTADSISQTTYQLGIYRFLLQIDFLK